MLFSICLREVDGTEILESNLKLWEQASLQSIVTPMKRWLIVQLKRIFGRCPERIMHLRREENRSEIDWLGNVESRRVSSPF